MEQSPPPTLSRASSRRYTALWALAGMGVALHLAGIAWDVYLHSHDETLAAREGVFTLSNPGHVLIMAGVAVTAAAVLGAGFAWVLSHTGGPARKLVAGTALPLLAISAGGAFWLAAEAEQSDSRQHAAAEAHHPEAAVAATGATQAEHAHDPKAAGAGSTMSSENAHFHGNEVAVSEENVRKALTFVDEVKAATAKYEDVAVALNSSFVQVTQDLEGIAAHFINYANNADGQDLAPGHPEVLLYSKRLDGTWRFVGVMFQTESITETPPSAFGGLDVWHYHEDLCFEAGRGVRIAKEAECLGGTFVARTPWELHVWTQPGASGLFAHDYAPISPGGFPPATRTAAQDVARSQTSR